MEYHTEIESLKRSLEAAQILEEQKQEQIDSNQNELLRLRSELREKSIETTMWEKEKSHLEKRMAELKDALDNAKQNSTVSSAEYQQIKAERDVMENQVEFMNKVIVDMQQKNDDLKGKLEILETEVIFDGNIQIGNNHHSPIAPVPYARSTSRLYCELCELHGLHDTAQCPKKDKSGLLSPTASLSVCEESEMF